MKLKTYTGEPLHVHGQITANVQYQNKKHNLLLIVAGEEGPSLLGRDWLYSLRLDWNTILHLHHNSLSDILQKYSSVFSKGLETLKGFKAKLYVNNTKPIFCKAHPVPYAIRSQVEAELEELVKQKILEPVPFSDWAAPIVHLKQDKCKFLVPSISYLGHKIDAEGLHPLSDKIKAITNASVPKTVTELKAFLGLMNYYGKFIPNIATILHPLYQLLNSSVPWSWTQERDEAFNKAKTLLTSARVLIHFDPQKDLMVSCDASAYGVGAVLSHKLSDGSERPVYLV